MLFSLKDLTSKLSPDGQGLDHLHTVKTNAFTLHHYQSPSGLMFVLNTHPDVAGEILKPCCFTNVIPTQLTYFSFRMFHFNRFSQQFAARLLQYLRRMYRSKPFVQAQTR